MSSGKTMAGPGTGRAPQDLGQSSATRRGPSIDTIPNVPYDPPPAYSDDEEDIVQVPHPTAITPHTYGEDPIGARVIDGGKTLSTYRNRKTYTVTLHDEYSSNPSILRKAIEEQAKMPPVPFIHVRGSHIEKHYSNSTRRDRSECEASSTTVVDFDFLIDTAGMVLPTLSDALFRHQDLEREAFWKLDVVQDNDDRNAYRGGRLKTRNRTCKRRARDQEQLLGETTLEDWCFRYCSNKAKVKSYTFKREICGDWDKNVIVAEITALIRALDYQGDIDVLFETKHTQLTIYSPHLFNRLRTNEMVRWLFVILQLWIIAWPILILLERRYEPVNAQWFPRSPFSKYATGMNEQEMVHFLAPAIRNAASGCRKNQEVITVHDVNRMRQHAIREARWHGDNSWLAGLVGSDVGPSGGLVVPPVPILQAQAVLPPGQEDTWMGTLMGIGRDLTRAGTNWGRSHGWGGHQV
ncbi:hypothetical protein KEM56_001000 [Ascosphaera pollenicola]|nr:hypothetical protein KEM56_001000 [Ascosphaera pollenicola]